MNAGVVVNGLFEKTDIGVPQSYMDYRPTNEAGRELRFFLSRLYCVLYWLCDVITLRTGEQMTVKYIAYRGWILHGNTKES